MKYLMFVISIIVFGISLFGTVTKEEHVMLLHIGWYSIILSVLFLIVDLLMKLIDALKTDYYKIDQLVKKIKGEQ